MSKISQEQELVADIPAFFSAKSTLNRIRSKVQGVLQNHVSVEGICSAVEDLKVRDRSSFLFVDH